MQTKAIILKKQNTGEYDQWVTCYTEDFGKLTAVAKSILRPSSIQALHLDTFSLVEFDLISGRGMPIITGAQAVDSFRNIKNSLIKTATAYFFTEAIDRMVFENDTDEHLWNFLISFFSELDQTSKPLALFRQGQARLLDILGYFPSVDSCKACDDKLGENNFGAFNHVLGGVICKECFLSGHSGILISQSDFEILHYSHDRVINMTSSLVESYKKSILDGMFEYISGSKFYSLDLLNMIR